MATTTMMLALAFLWASPVVAQERQSRIPEALQEFDREALPADVLFQGEGRFPVLGVRCATRPVGELESRLIETELRRWRRRNSVNGAFLLAARTLSIPVAFHVIHNGSQGNVPDSMLDQQIAVLNGAFSSAGYSFHRASVSRTDNSSWFAGCAGSAESAIKSALAVDPATTLNFYTCQPTGGILGYAYLPQDLPESSKTHGVVILHSSLPGGSAAPYDLGDTGTHEVGHYLGLYHTFDPEPNGCGGNGDFVADTPPERTPAYGCPTGRDSCSGGGADPIDNFMDYTDDSCMNTFTSLQGARMNDLVGLYKPSLGGGGGGDDSCGAKRILAERSHR